MNKFTLVIMATLCLVFTSCSDQLGEITTSENVELETRSANHITATLVSLEGVTNTLQCTRVVITYQDATAASALFTYADNTTSYSLVSAVSLSVPTSYTLDVDASGTAVESADLTIDLCETELCYVNGSGSVVGTALDFIVEDETSGL